VDPSPRRPAIEPVKPRGGRRAGAGRPSKPGSVSHRRRPGFRPHSPIHVTLRVARHVWNLRAQRCLRPIDAALRALRSREERFRVTHFSVQGNHLHFVVEARDRHELASAFQSFGIRVARALHRVMGRKGRVFAARYHARALRTPTEVVNVVRYVLANHARHVPGAAIADRFSSAAVFTAWEALELPSARVTYALPGLDPPVVPARGHLLRSGLAR